MKLKDAFLGSDEKPMMTVQRKQNQRPHMSHKFNAKIGVKGKYKTGRKPSDIRPRFKEVIPPTRKKVPVA